MKVDLDRQIAQKRLQEMGYTPEPINRPGPTDKSADLWAHADRIVRGEVDRSDENAVRKALCEQYPGYKFILFDMK